MAEEARIQITVDSKNSEATLKKLDSQMKKTGKTADGLDRSTSKLSKGFSGLAKASGALIAAGFSVQALAEVQKISEEFTLLEARTRRLSKSTEEAAATYQSLLEISNRTGQQLGDTVQLWSQLTGSLDESNDRILAFTEQLQKLGNIGGSSQEELSNALRQLN